MHNNKEWVFRLIVIGLVILWSGSLFWCTKAGDSYKNNPDVYSKERRECIEPENPYDEWSWHYAGYEWWEQWNYCSGNSDSFIEWCEMFEELDETFAECEDAQ